jgi:hypothetical protein
VTATDGSLIDTASINININNIAEGSNSGVSSRMLMIEIGSTSSGWFEHDVTSATSIEKNDSNQVTEVSNTSYTMSASTIDESGYYNTENTTIHWGVWDDASGYHPLGSYQEYTFITEERETTDAVSLPTSGIMNYTNVSESGIRFSEGVYGDLTTASLNIDFGTNAVNASLNGIDENGLEIHNANTLSGTLDSNGAFQAGSDLGYGLRGIPMGNNGSHYGAIYNIQWTDDASVNKYGTGAVVFEAQQ